MREPNLALSETAPLLGPQAALALAYNLRSCRVHEDEHEHMRPWQLDLVGIRDPSQAALIAKLLINLCRGTSRSSASRITDEATGDRTRYI